MVVAAKPWVSPTVRLICRHVVYSSPKHFEGCRAGVAMETPLTPPGPGGWGWGSGKAGKGDTCG